MENENWSSHRRDDVQEEGADRGRDHTKLVTMAPSSPPTMTLLAIAASLAILAVGANAFSVRAWQRANPYPYPAPRAEIVESPGSATITAQTLSQSSGYPLCRGSRDKEPAEYTCRDQVEWGKCNETWLIEGDFCAEQCGRCKGRVPVALPGNLSEPVETRATGDRMPDVGTKKCGGHITYEWRIRTREAKEASGLAASAMNDHILWTHVDGWTTKVLAFLSDTISIRDKPGDFGLQGQPVLELDLPDWVNKNPRSGRVDWEDISTAQCPDGSKRQCLWISDTGNNKFNRGYSQVIAVVEPEVAHIKMDPERRISTQYFTPNQVDKRNRAGICQPGMGGSDCRHHQCKSDETHLEKLDYKDLEKASRGESLWVFAFKYPGTKEKDAEGLAVAPDGSRFWLFEKNEELRGANIYESEILSEVITKPKWNGKYLKTSLFSIAFIKPPCVAAGTNCVSLEKDHLFSITGADVHPLGHSVTLQTYKGPFVYEFDADKPFDISGMQGIVPRPVLPYSEGWGAEAIAYSKEGDRLWQMPEENRHDGCQKVLVMDCAQPNIFTQDPGLQVRSEPTAGAGGNTTTTNGSTLMDNIKKIQEDFLSRESGAIGQVKDEVEEVESILEDIVDQIESIAEEGAKKPLVCEIIPNGWGTEKNASIPICAGQDKVPTNTNSSEVFSCEDQAAWGKCGEEWLVQGNYCMGSCGRCTHTTCSCPDCKRLKKPQLLCNANQVISSDVNASNVVIFDFDDTLKLHHPARQAPQGLWAVRETVRLGYGIAIATASCHTDYVKKFLGKMEPEIFTPEFLESNAFQSCQKKKTGALKCNLAHYNLLDRPECAVFFDDSVSNEKYADKAGIKMIEVKKGVGVTEEKFRRGVQHMLHECAKPRIPVKEGACDPRLDRSPPGEHTCKEQKRWGKCNETWIVEGDYCQATCGRCGNKTSATTETSTNLVRAIPK